MVVGGRKGGGGRGREVPPPLIPSLPWGLGITDAEERIYISGGRDEHRGWRVLTCLSPDLPSLHLAALCWWKRESRPCCGGGGGVVW